MQCTSKSAIVYSISKEHFLATIRDHTFQYRLGIGQGVLKTKRHQALDLNVKAIKSNEIVTAFSELSKKAKNQYLSKIYRRQIQNPLKA